MDELPSGTVTFLFADIEGSTRLLNELGGDRYAEILGEHERLLRAAFAAHQGAVVDTQGDSFFVAFRTASDAVAAAFDAQPSFLGSPGPGNHPFDDPSHVPKTRAASRALGGHAAA